MMVLEVRKMEYRYFNPYEHLTKVFTLTHEEWERIKAQLGKADLDAIESGGRVRVGAAAKVWKA